MDGGTYAAATMATPALPPLSAAERRPSWVDVGVVAAMLLLGLLGVFLAHDLGGPEDQSRIASWADYTTLVILVLPILVRRMAPAAVCVFVSLFFVAFRLLEVPEGPVSSVAVFMAIHAAGAHVADARRRNGARALALGTGFVALVVQLSGEIEAVGFEAVVGLTFSIGLNLGFYVAAWVLGDRDRHQRIDRAELSRRADQLATEREARAEQAVVAERVRIARELHDVVAHHVSVMGVQAAAARHVMGRDPARAAEALGTVEASARQAVDELQRLVGILREAPSDGVDAPQPTLDGLPALVATLADAGLPVELREIGRSPAMPDSVGLSAHRIVQEALTNVMRHAPGAETTVVLTHLAGVLQVEVVNGPAPAGATPAGPGGGRGLLGMRERAAMLGGRVEAGLLPRGGYRVAATLPLPGGVQDRPGPATVGAIGAHVADGRVGPRSGPELSGESGLAHTTNVEHTTNVAHTNKTEEEEVTR